MRDRMYADEPGDPGGFVFNDQVADVFPDMIARSVPGYAATLRLIGSIASRHVQPGGRCYDLGCSLGAASLAVHDALGDTADIMAIDRSEAMIQRLDREIAQRGISTLRTQVADIRNVRIQNADLTVLNFTLQFIPPGDRLDLLRRIANGTRPGGVLVLSEKIRFEDHAVETEMKALHEAFKKANGYSDLEISRKRSALENVLIPETLQAHQRRLREAGFARVQVWLQCFNFMSLLAFRE